jgi:transketolase
VHEALQAADELAGQGLPVRVIDCYSVKPIDGQGLVLAGQETGGVLVVEDHYPEGGLGEAVAASLAATSIPVHSLAVTRPPRSGSPDELLDYEGISRRAIAAKVRELLG